MKPMRTLPFVFLMFLASQYCLADTFLGAEFLSYKEARKKWGEMAFSGEKFKSALEKEKAPMAVNALKINAYVGKDMLQVRKDLGSPDSYFFSDTIFAYSILPFPGENKETWHLIFIPNEKLEKVKEIKIHKKCCYKMP